MTDTQNGLNGCYARVPLWATQLSSLEALRALIALCRFVDSNGECYPKYETLAALARLDDRHLARAFDRLEALGGIERKRRPGQSTLYKVRFSLGALPLGAAPPEAAPPEVLEVSKPLKKPTKGATKPQKKTRGKKANNLPTLEAFELTPDLSAELASKYPLLAGNLDLLCRQFKNDEWVRRKFAAGDRSDPARNFDVYVSTREGWARERAARPGGVTRPAPQPSRPSGSGLRPYTPEQLKAING